jgi:hypothetical protein
MLPTFISKAGLTNSKTTSNPLELNVKLNATDGEPLPDTTMYRQLVDSLIYLTVTRPDLAYVVHLVSHVHGCFLFHSLCCCSPYSSVRQGHTFSCPPLFRIVFT